MSRKSFGIAVVVAVAAVFAVTTQASSSGKYSFLRNLEVSDLKWTPEDTGSHFFEEHLPPVDQALDGFYADFEADKVVTIHVSWGYEAWHSGRPSELFNMLQSLAAHENLNLVDWSMNSSQTQISFKNLDTDVVYVIDAGHERDGFQAAFENHEVVMYHGHSRYGRGPAFDSYWNYFRMGDVFNTIEIDTRNKYFHKEPMMLTSQYPSMNVILDGQDLRYQYRGGKLESSYLPSDSYTKNIPGGAKDLKTTKYLEGRQMFYFYSCRNEYYWKNSVRNQFPSTAEKFVIGTNEDGYWSTQPEAVFIMSIVGHTARSTDIVDDLNAVGDCSNCFTSY